MPLPAIFLSFVIILHTGRYRVLYELYTIIDSYL